jgi:hypothetical protein
MQIIKNSITLGELEELAQRMFGNFVKAVVDTEKKIMAVDAELHADLEAFLLENGSEQKNLWGINIYPKIEGEELIEFDSMINIRPSQNNRSRSVEDSEKRKKIIEIVDGLIKK